MLVITASWNNVDRLFELRCVKQNYINGIFNLLCPQGYSVKRKKSQFLQKYEILVFGTEWIPSDFWKLSFFLIFNLISKFVFLFPCIADNIVSFHYSYCIYTTPLLLCAYIKFQSCVFQ